MKFNVSNSEQDFLKSVFEGKEPELTIFYEKYDRLVWDLSNKWYKTINALSLKEYELDDIHNEVWSHIFKNFSKYDPERSGLSSWISLVGNSKLGMIRRSLLSKKDSRVVNQTSFAPISSTEGLNFVDIAFNPDDSIKNFIEQDNWLDYIYLLLELINSCTEKERKVYLLKIAGKSQTDIAETANVSKSYVPKVYKRLTKKFKMLYDSLDDQQYIDKKERNSLSKDLLARKPTTFICDKYDLELETVSICKEMLDIIGFHS